MLTEAQCDAKLSSWVDPRVATGWRAQKQALECTEEEMEHQPDDRNDILQ